MVWISSRKSSSLSPSPKPTCTVKVADTHPPSGTDTATGLKGTAFGLSLHQELTLYVERCGFSPIEALSSATSVSARRFRMDDRGVLKEGLKADVLMVKGNPTVDIRDLGNVEGVWRGGERLAV